MLLNNTGPQYLGKINEEDPVATLTIGTNCVYDHNRCFRNEYQLVPHRFAGLWSFLTYTIIP